MSSEPLTVAGLERWALSGAPWRVVDISGQRVVVDLCTCMGEPIERVESGDPAVISYLRTASSDSDVSEAMSSNPGE
jgi:hypothetical protein